MLDVDLIRHAYVSPNYQRQGVGSALLGHLARSTNRRMLVGIGAAADWAVRFYHRHGFELVGPEHTPAPLKRYWAIPDRQIDASVVLANPPLAATPSAPANASSASSNASATPSRFRKGPHPG